MPPHPRPLSRPRRQLCASAALLPWVALAPSTRAEDATIPVQHLRDDLLALRLGVLQRHPRYHGRAALEPALEAAFGQVHAGLTRPLPRATAWRHFARLNPQYRDAHTLLMPWPEGESPEATTPLFPFGVDLASDGQLHLRSQWRHSVDGLELPARAVVRAINGVSASAILAQLEPFSHGETAALRRHMLTLMFPHWLHAVLGWRERFQLELGVDAGSKPMEVRLSPADRWTPVRPPATTPTWRVLGADTGVLRVPTFDVDENPAAFAAAVSEAFRGLREHRLTRLVIDVRGNTGGQSEAGAQLLRHLIDRPVQQVSRARERLNADNNGWLGWRGAPGTVREFDLGRDGLVEPAPAAERFRGRVAVLIDEMTYSAAILFVTAVQDLRLGVLVGRPTGGFANQTGNMVPLRLRHSGLTCFIPSRVFVRPNGDLREAQVQPDLTTTGEDGGSRADATLEHAVRWLASRTSPDATPQR
jgi:hypothetical protein